MTTLPTTYHIIYLRANRLATNGNDLIATPSSDTVSLPGRPPAGSIIEVRGRYFNVVSYMYRTTDERWYIQLLEVDQVATLELDRMMGNDDDDTPAMQVIK